MSSRGIEHWTMTTTKTYETCQLYTIPNKKCISTHCIFVVLLLLMFFKTVTNCDMKLCYLVVLMPSAALVIYYELNHINFNVRFFLNRIKFRRMCHMRKYSCAISKSKEILFFFGAVWKNCMVKGIKNILFNERIWPYIKNNENFWNISVFQRKKAIELLIYLLI